MNPVANTDIYTTPPLKLSAHGRWPTDVDVWHVDIPTGLMDWWAVDQYLSEDERLRAARFVQYGDRLRFAVTRAALRSLLSTRVGEAPDALRFSLGQFGKPVLDGHPKISFNVTHSGQHALIALSNSRRLGIDIEVIEPSFCWQELLDLVCTSVERQTIVSTSRNSQRQLFFRCWTAKEALLKATGVGLADGLQGITLDLLSPSGLWLSGQPNEPQIAALFQFHWLSEITNCIACVAFEKKHPENR